MPISRSRSLIVASNDSLETLERLLSHVKAMKNGRCCYFCTSRSQSSRVYCTRKNCRFGNSGSGYPGNKSSHISATERAIHFYKGVKSIVFISSANYFPDICPIFSYTVTYMYPKPALLPHCCSTMRFVTNMASFVHVHTFIATY